MSLVPNMIKHKNFQEKRNPMDSKAIFVELNLL